MTTDELFERIALWGEGHNISNPLMQMVKVQEETGEIAHELTRGNWKSAEIKDAIGDSLVTIIILADILGFDARKCLELAYSEIKDRKGKTIDGGFIKDE